MALPTDPTQPAQPTPQADPTASIAKKAPALPLAPATPASPTLGAATNPTATTQPVGPVTPAGPATTSDPMAFAPTNNPAPNAPAVPTTSAPAAADRSQFNSDADFADYNQYQDHLKLQNQWSNNLSAQMGFVPQNGDEWVQRYAGPEASRHAVDPTNSPVASDAFLTNYNPNDPNQLGKSAGLDAAWTTDKAAYDKNWNAFTSGQSFTNPENLPNNSPAYQQMKDDAWNTLLPPDPVAPNGGGTPAITPDPGSLNGMPSRSLKPGPANDVNPHGQLPLGNPPAMATPSGAGPGSTGGASNGGPATGGLNGMPGSTSSNGTVGMTPTDPSHSLMGQTLSVGPTADRFKVAQDEWDQFEKATDPAYQATLRSQDAHDFGLGRGVSGMHKNSIGDIATQRTTAMDTQKKTFLDQALNSSVDDAYKNVGIAQQQQQFQESLQEQAFRQGLSLQQLSDAENSQSFQQAYQKAILGYSGDPAQLYIQMAAQWAKTGATA